MDRQMEIGVNLLSLFCIYCVLYRKTVALIASYSSPRTFCISQQDVDL